MALTTSVSCGGGDDGLEDHARATTTIDPTTTTQLAPEEEAEAVYLEFVDTVMRLLTTEPDPANADLAQLAVDPVLGRIRDNLTTMQAENHIVQRGERTSQEVISTTVDSLTSVVLRVCDVGNDTTIDRDDGAIVDEGLSTRLLEVTVTSHGDKWVVSDIATLERFSGEVPCPD